MFRMISFHPEGEEKQKKASLTEKREAKREQDKR